MLPTSSEQVSSPWKLTIGLPPDSSSIRFWGRNRATTLMLFAADMLIAAGPSCGREVCETKQEVQDKCRKGDCCSKLGCGTRGIGAHCSGLKKRVHKQVLNTPNHYAASWLVLDWGCWTSMLLYYTAGGRNGHNRRSRLNCCELEASNFQRERSAIADIYTSDMVARTFQFCDRGAEQYHSCY